MSLLREPMGGMTSTGPQIGMTAEWLIQVGMNMDKSLPHFLHLLPPSHCWRTPRGVSKHGCCTRFVAALQHHFETNRLSTLAGIEARLLQDLNVRLGFFSQEASMQEGHHHVLATNMAAALQLLPPSHCCRPPMAAAPQTPKGNGGHAVWKLIMEACLLISFSDRTLEKELDFLIPKPKRKKRAAEKGL